MGFSALQTHLVTSPEKKARLEYEPISVREPIRMGAYPSQSDHNDGEKRESAIGSIIYRQRGFRPMYSKYRQKWGNRPKLLSKTRIAESAE